MIKSSKKILIGIFVAIDYNSSIPNLINQGKILRYNINKKVEIFKP